MAMMPFLDQMPLDEQSKNMVLAMMNAEHPDAIRAYVRHFGGKKKAMHAKLCDVGCETISLSYTGPGKDKGECTMPYVDEAGKPLVIRSVGDCRRALVGMAYAASDALGEDIELPARPAPAAPAGSEGDRDFGPHRAEMQELIRQLGSDRRPPPEEMAQLAQRLQELKALAEGGGNPAGAAEGGGASGGSSSSYTAFKGGYVAAPRDGVFKGEGSKLGSATLAPAAAALGDAATKAYHLMEVTGFPPKKLTDMSATMAQLGLSSASSLSCRPA